ncbi:SAM-dependent methyltransferase, partial [Clostridioides difficile]|nr:SAM-dependent methyltransferase [Clostridioides difficile]
MKSILCQINKQPVKAKYTSDELECFLDTIEYNVGDKILLVGHIGNLGKRLRGLGTSVTILENSNYEDVCYSLVYNENCNVVKGKLEFLPFDDNQFNKIIIVDQFNVIT